MRHRPSAPDDMLQGLIRAVSNRIKSADDIGIAPLVIGMRQAT
jgi:hypothetical protein